MSAELLKKAENLINQCTAHTRESGLTFDWVMALTDELGYPSASMITASRADGLKWIAFCKEWAGSKGCPIHKCAKQHKVQFCGLCHEFPCDWLIEKVTWNPNIVGELTSLAKIYHSQRSADYAEST